MSTDSTIMLRRNFKHTVRNPVAVFNAVLLPIVIMLMFVGEIGGAFNVGVKYVEYATPGMTVLTICYGLSATALAVNATPCVLSIAAPNSRCESVAHVNLDATLGA